MARIKEYNIILIFCFLHAAVSFASREIGFHDEMALTLLTMLMSVMLSMRRQMSVPFMVGFDIQQLAGVFVEQLRHLFHHLRLVEASCAPFFTFRHSFRLLFAAKIEDFI